MSRKHLTKERECSFDASQVTEMRKAPGVLDEVEPCSLAMTADSPVLLYLGKIIIGLRRQHVWESTKLLSQFRCPSRINADRTLLPEQRPSYYLRHAQSQCSYPAAGLRQSRILFRHPVRSRYLGCPESGLW